MLSECSARGFLAGYAVNRGPAGFVVAHVGTVVRSFRLQPRSVRARTELVRLEWSASDLRARTGVIKFHGDL